MRLNPHSTPSTVLSGNEHAALAAIRDEGGITRRGKATEFTALLNGLVRRGYLMAEAVRVGGSDARRYEVTSAGMAMLMCLKGEWGK